MSSENDYSAYYRAKLESALAYEDFVYQELYKIGLPVVSFKSKRFQYDVGENIAGIEIKFDEKYEETGNLYIEVAEKSHPDNYEYVASGIFREDNAWLYVVGNYAIIYVFSKTMLKGLYTNRKTRGIPEVEKDTSRGFLLPGCLAKKYAAKIIRIR